MGKEDDLLIRPQKFIPGSPATAIWTDKHGICYITSNNFAALLAQYSNGNLRKSQIDDDYKGFPFVIPCKIGDKDILFINEYGVFILSTEMLPMPGMFHHNFFTIIRSFRILHTSHHQISYIDPNHYQFFADASGVTVESLQLPPKIELVRI